VYEGAPTNSTFFFAVITKLSIFVLLIRLFYISFFSFKNCWQFYSLWIGIISIFVGSFGGLKQRRLKTLLAYSSTSHMGYILIAFSTSTVLSIQMLLFYMFIYMISGFCFWYIILLLRLKKKNIKSKYNKELSDLVLLKKSNKALAISLSLTMFSIAGIPPMVGFLGVSWNFWKALNINKWIYAWGYEKIWVVFVKVDSLIFSLCNLVWVVFYAFKLNQLVLRQN